MDEAEKRELQQLRAIIQQKGMQSVAEFGDGLDFCLAMAARGEPRAIQLLESLAEGLERLQAIRSRLVIPRPVIR